MDEKLKDNIYPDQIEQDLVHSLRAGKADIAKEKYQQMLKLLLNCRFNTIVFAYKRLYLTVLSLYQDTFHLQEEEWQPDTLEMLDEKFRSAKHFDEISMLFYHLFDCIAEQVESNRQNKSQKLIETICSIIENKYNDAALSPQMVSDAMGMSPSYLGKLFRSSENISINEHINHVRIEHAKQLLCSSSLPVKEIAEKVGFANSQYFYTLFKNNTHQTPKEYRIFTRKESWETNPPR